MFTKEEEAEERCEQLREQPAWWCEEEGCCWRMGDTEVAGTVIEVEDLEVWMLEAPAGAL